MKYTSALLEKTISIAFLLLDLLVFAFVWDYSPTDRSFFTYNNNQEYQNCGGWIGANIAAFMMHTFGYCSFFILGIIAVICILVINGKNLTHLNLIAFLLSIPLFCTLFCIFDRNVIEDSADIIYLGGFLGFFLKTELYLNFQNHVLLDALVFFTSLIGIYFSLGLGIGEYYKYVKRAVIDLYLLCRFLTFYSIKLLKWSLSSFRKVTNYNVDNNIESEVSSDTDFSAFLKEKKISEINEVKRKPAVHRHHMMPPIDLLGKASNKQSVNIDKEDLNNKANELLNVLKDFGVYGDIVNIYPGPVVTLYELFPASGTKSSRVIGLADDIARSMSALSARIAVIPGKNAIGIELPNKFREVVHFRDLLESTEYSSNDLKLPLALGKNIAGTPVIADLSRMPHLLVAGTTGSGKSVAINTMIASLIYRHSPDECKFVMIDPKMLELSIYENIPHLLAPVVTDPKKAVITLKCVVMEMEARYKSMALLGVRNIDGYNNIMQDSINKGGEIKKRIQTGFDNITGKPIYEEIIIKSEKLPYIVVIVDEMADLMLVAGKEIESYVQRLAQMARAAGIHIIMATQRPSVDVVTGVIKANFPTRISFQVTSKIDSRTILGEIGAEQLLGLGDMLHMKSGGAIERVHGAFIKDNEVESIVQFLCEQSPPQYMESFMNLVVKEGESEEHSLSDSYGRFSDKNDRDDLYQKAVEIVMRDRKASISYVQRCLRIGYNRAASLVEKMEKEGIVSSPDYTGKRDILM